MMELILNNFITIGLIFDVFGVALLWKYGIPNTPLARKGYTHSPYVEDDMPAMEPRKEIRKFYLRLAADNAGFLFLIIGFLFQIAGNYYVAT